MGSFLWSVAALTQERPNLVPISLSLLAAANAAIEVNQTVSTCAHIAIVVAERFVEGTSVIERHATISTLDGFDVPSPLVRVLCSAGLGFRVKTRDMDILRSQIPDTDYHALEGLVSQLGLL
jgi:hypothetical protein